MGNLKRMKDKDGNVIYPVTVAEGVSMGATAGSLATKIAEIDAALALKADVVTGKGLSTNDYTTAEKTKLANIEAGAQVNTVTGVKGSSETSYRTGNINITAANVGLGNVTNESKATMFSSAALTGTPTAPTASASTNNTQIANTAYVTSAVSAEATARTSAVNSAKAELQSNIDDLESQMQTEHASHLAATNATLANYKALLDAQIEKEQDDADGLQAQITAGVATSGTITMVTSMDSTTDYSTEVDIAPSRHAVQSLINLEVANLNAKIDAMLVAVGDVKDYTDFSI